jgi:hypothetical protein
VPTAEARAARNENLYREVNEAIQRLQDELGDGDQTSPVQFICECSRYRCTDRVTLTLAEYAEVRADDAHFLIVPTHLDPDIERIIRRTREYAVVEKVGAAGEIAEADAR